MERLLSKLETQRAQERQHYVETLRAQAVETLLASAPADEELRAMAREFAERSVSIDPETLAIDTGQAPAFVARLATLQAPAAQGEAPPPAPTVFVHTPPEAEAAPARAADWQTRLAQNIESAGNE